MIAVVGPKEMYVTTDNCLTIKEGSRSTLGQDPLWSRVSQVPHSQSYQNARHSGQSSPQRCFFEGQQEFGAH